MPPIVRRIRADEWPELRRLRLSALREAPLAFGSTYETEIAFDDATWRRWAASGASGADEVLFAAALDGEFVAMARGSVSSEDARDAYLTAVFVAREWRGRGLGRAVSEAIIAWARERRCARLLLHVTDWNEPARRIYESLGFVPTGTTELLPHDPSVIEHEMAIPLNLPTGTA